MGSENSSGAGGGGGGVWKSGNLEIWEFGDLRTWKSRNLEIWGPGNPEMWGPKNQKNKILKIQIRSAQNVGKVWISRKKSSWPYLGPSEAIFSIGRKNQKKIQNFAYFPWWANGPLFTRCGPLLLSTRGGGIGIFYQQSRLKTMFFDLNPKGAQSHTSSQIQVQGPPNAPGMKYFRKGDP